MVGVMELFLGFLAGVSAHNLLERGPWSCWGRSKLSCGDPCDTTWEKNEVCCDTALWAQEWTALEVQASDFTALV
jgi:hypothetical protein